MENQKKKMYKVLREAVAKEAVWIEWGEYHILNPFYDETERKAVDPIEYYGLELINQAVAEYLMEDVYNDPSTETTVMIKTTEALRQLTSDGNCWIKAISPELTEDISQSVCDILNGLPVEYNVFGLSDTVIMIELDVPEA